MKDVTIRAVRADDCDDLYEMLACPGVVRNTLQIPYVSLDRREQWLSNLTDNDYMLVAEVDGRVVGNIEITRRKNRLAHVAQLGMAVHDDYQDRGIGTALMEAALDLADNWLNIKRVELDVYTDNDRAVHLYEKFGFEIEGTLRSLAFREGEYVDAYHMARLRGSGPQTGAVEPASVDDARALRGTGWEGDLDAMRSSCAP